MSAPNAAGREEVFLTNHGRNRPWLYTAVNRGYIAYYYYATDPNYRSEEHTSELQ